MFKVIYEPTYNNIKKAKGARYSTSDLKNLHMLPENSAKGLESRGDCCWSYIAPVFENTPKNLVVQGRLQLEHSYHIV